MGEISLSDSVIQDQTARSVQCDLDPSWAWSTLSEKRLTLLANDKILNVNKLKAFADDKLNIAKMTIFSMIKQTTLGKGENAGYQHFLLFPQCFPKFSSSGSLKVGSVW